MATSETPEALTWSVDLGADRPGKRLLVVAVALAAGLVGIALFHQVVLGLVGCLAILLSTAEMFLPVRYRIDPNGASAQVGLSKTMIDWAAVRRVDVGTHGVKLSPLARADHRLDPFRGVTLRFAGNREEVLEAIEKYRSGVAADQEASSAKPEGRKTEEGFG
jgi:hypothetical protein